MDYTLDFGTRFAARISALAIGAILSVSASFVISAPAVNAQAQQAQQPRSDVVVNVTNLRNKKGQLMVCLTANPKAFPDCSKDKRALKKLVSASQSSIVFKAVKKGTYAVAIVHDENRNNKMDLAIFVPKEGFAFSRNPKIGMGPPKFKKASFIVGAKKVVQNVKMKYIF